MSNNKSRSTPSLALAPMAGFTNKAFRQICFELGADVTWSEMVSSEGLIRQKNNFNKSLTLTEKFSSQEKNYWVQIFGTDPQIMAQSAHLIEKRIHPKGIDINLGCPVSKARRAGYGAIQIKNIPQVIQIIQAIKKEISLPLSLKTRLGLSRAQEILEWAPLLEQAGLDQLAVHARTLQGMFFEKPHWEIVQQLKNTLNIPLIYNGGINSPQKAFFYFQKTKTPVLMIGQASLGNPWIFQEIKKYFLSNFTNRYLLPYQQTNFKEIVFRHAQLTKKFYGEKALIPFRSHLSFYFKNMPQAKRLREKAVQITTLKDVEKILEQI